MHAGGVQGGPAVAVLEKWSVACGWGTGGPGWRQGRGCQMPPRESRPHRQGSGRKGAKGGLKWQVSACLIFHPSHSPFVVQSKQKCPDWIWLQEHRWMCSHADTCAHLCVPDKNIHPIKWKDTFLSYWNLYTLVKRVISWLKHVHVNWGSKRFL